MLRSWTASISALFVISALMGCSSDSSDAPAQPTPAQDAAAEQGEDSSTGEDAQAEAAPEASTGEDGAGEAEAAVKKCPNEKDLTTVTLPCDCYGTIVEDPEAQMPTCELKVVCCPGIQGLKCE